VSALAAPGQVLVEGSGLGLNDTAFTMREDSALLLPPLEGEHTPPTPQGDLGCRQHHVYRHLPLHFSGILP
jgi:hypothetical protein